eukprot:TRINITY_DN15332_c0_g1_i1.p1 TRINITY_DN15332_c0_g1~~TRINITY_DN15332_c0_g1_i1.p1  ORF type:complete len:698 (-),score=106.62 TRINITY_DN15332_c0_g1_i1:94-2187(-)
MRELSHAVAISLTCAALPILSHAGATLADDKWPRNPPSYPKFPGRDVRVLNGTWDFSYLGEVPFTADVPEPTAWMPIEVPDAFDVRRDQPRCSACWPEGDAAEEESQCRRCCDRSLGYHGDPKCWRDRHALEDGVWKFEEVEAMGHNFSYCCGQDAHRGRRGVAIYRVVLKLPALRSGLLRFAGCGLRCKVVVDGEELADHAGLSPFSVEVRAARRKDNNERELRVIVDNRFDLASHPVHQPKYDWWQAGGLLRHVQFHWLSAEHLSYIASVKVFPRGSSRVDVVVQPSADAAADDSVSYSFRFSAHPQALDDRCSDAKTWQQMDVRYGLRDHDVQGAKLWEPRRPGRPGSPQLHYLRVAMLASTGDRVIDCMEVRFGLRTVEAKGREILVNGQGLRLIGFNRHDWGQSPVVKYDELVHDMDLLLDLGANFVRGAHYAQDERWLDLCDVNGVVVWDEVLGWQNTVADFEDANFMNQMMTMADEITVSSTNHPSVLLLGFFNEGESFDDSAATSFAYEAMADHLRRHTGRTKLISFGSNHREQDRQLDNADVCAFHLYAAWYPTTHPVSEEEVNEIPYIWHQYSQWVAGTHPEKPLLITEAGAGGLYGYRGQSDRKWTEDYHSLLVQTHLRSVLENPLIAGISIWQFADIPVDRNVSNEQHRPRGQNNKGVVSVKRQPKLAFHTFRHMMRVAVENDIV